MIEFRFELSKDLLYAKDGLQETARYLRLIAPSVKNGAIVARIKQQILQAFRAYSSENPVQTTDSAATGKEDSLSGSTLIQLLYTSNSVDMEKLLEDFKNLLINNCCFIEDSKQGVTNANLLEISFEDIENMMGEYFVNFLLTFLSKKSS